MQALLLGVLFYEQFSCKTLFSPKICQKKIFGVILNVEEIQYLLDFSSSQFQFQFRYSYFLVDEVPLRCYCLPDL